MTGDDMKDLREPGKAKHRLTRPHGERLPWREKLPATLQDHDFEFLLLGSITSEMQDAIEKVHADMEWRTARRDSNRRKAIA